MATPSTLSQAELLSTLLAVATANTGTALSATDGTITGSEWPGRCDGRAGGRRPPARVFFPLARDESIRQAFSRGSRGKRVANSKRK